MSKRLSEDTPNSNKRQVTESFLSDFLKKGYCVVPSVISEEKVDSLHADFWKFLAAFGTGIDRNDPMTWVKKQPDGVDPWPPSIRGLLQHYGIGHSKFVWELRSETAIRRVFAALHGLDDSKETDHDTRLVVSFDGACLAKPETRKVDPVKNSWAHIDQGPRSAGAFKMVQGLLTLTEAGPGKGGLIVYEGSNRLHGRFFRKFPELVKKVGAGDWCKLEAKHKAWYMKHKCKEVQVSAPKGSLLLWDSRYSPPSSSPRTVHYAVRPTMGSLIPRAAIYLCYQGRDSGTPAQLARKQQVFRDRRMTSHWPHKSKLFAVRMRSWGDATLALRFPDQPAIKDEEMTPVMWKLAGY
jgi:hypothetical protein